MRNCYMAVSWLLPFFLIGNDSLRWPTTCQTPLTDLSANEVFLNISGDGPRRSQDGSDGPRSVQDGSHAAPSRPPDGQDDPQMDRDGSPMAPTRPQERPKMAPDGHKMAPVGPKMASDGSNTCTHAFPGSPRRSRARKLYGHNARSSVMFWGSLEADVATALLYFKRFPFQCSHRFCTAALVLLLFSQIR